MSGHGSQHENIISAIKQSPSCINERLVAVDNAEITALHYAVVMNDGNLVRELLDLGADIECRNDVGHTPLMMAAYNKRRSIARLLVQRGADLTAVSAEGKTVLHYASQYGDIELAKQVLDARVPVNAADFEGYTALHCSVINDEVEAVEMLIKHGADPTAKTSKSARHGGSKSVRDFAESFSKRSVARLAAQPQTQPRTQEKRWWEFWKTKAIQLKAGSPNKGPSVLQAVIDKDPTLALDRLHQDGSVDEKGQYGNVALHYAAAYGYLDVIEAILKAGGTVDPKNTAGQTPLVYAMLEGQPAAARLLWKHQSSKFNESGRAKLIRELCSIGVDWSFLPGEASSGYFQKGSPIGHNFHPRAKQIGDELHKDGGIEAMRDAHASIAQILGDKAASNLSCIWNHVGDWID